MRNKINDESTKRLLSALEEMYDNLMNGNNRQISPSTILKKYQIPYYTAVVTILFRQDILSYRKDKDCKRLHYWTTPAEPDIHMANFVFVKVKEYNKANQARMYERAKLIRRVTNDDENTLTQQQPPDVTPYFKVLLSDDECTRIKSLDSSEQIEYIRVVLDNGMCKIRQIFFKDKHPIPFATISVHLLQSKYEDHITHIELTEFRVIGQIISVPTFLFAGDR